MPIGPSGFSTMKSVAAISPNDVWAVGSYFSVSPVNRLSTLAEHWNGTSWTQVPTPNRGTTDDNELSGVVAVSPRRVVAVGDVFFPRGTFPSRPIIERWNGTAWTMQAGATISSDSILASIATSAPKVLIAVGSFLSSAPTPGTLVEERSG
jgi:hypothetical protein